MEEFQHRLIKLRKEKGLTQDQLAEILDMSRSALSLYELGLRKPDYATLERMSDYFNTTTDYLLMGRSDTHKTAEQRIESAISEESELLEFFQELKRREELQLLFKQVKPLPSDAIKQVIKYAKFIEDEESKED